MIIKTIKEAIDKYREIIYDIIYNSPSREIAYLRGLSIGGPMLAMLCSVWWNNHHDGTPPSSGLLLK